MLNRISFFKLIMFSLKRSFVFCFKGKLSTENGRIKANYQFLLFRSFICLYNLSVITNICCWIWISVFSGCGFVVSYLQISLHPAFGGFWRWEFYRCQATATCSLRHIMATSGSGSCSCTCRCLSCSGLFELLLWLGLNLLFNHLPNPSPDTLAIDKSFHVQLDFILCSGFLLGPASERWWALGVQQALLVAFSV